MLYSPESREAIVGCTDRRAFTVWGISWQLRVKFTDGLLGMGESFGKGGIVWAKWCKRHERFTFNRFCHATGVKVPVLRLPSNLHLWGTWLATAVMPVGTTAF